MSEDLVVPTRSGSIALVDAVQEIIGLDSAKYVVNLGDVVDAAERAAILLSLQGQDTMGIDAVTTDGIAVSRWLLCQQPIEVEGGEVRVGWRTVLQSADGDQWSCMSQGVAADMVRIASALGPDAAQRLWDPPIHLIVRRIQTRRGYTAFRLAPFRQPIDTKGQSGGKKK